MLAVHSFPRALSSPFLVTSQVCLCVCVRLCVSCPSAEVSAWMYLMFILLASCTFRPLRINTFTSATCEQHLASLPCVCLTAKVCVCVCASVCVLSEYLRVDFIKFCAIYSHRVGVICITHQRQLIPITNCYKFAMQQKFPCHKRGARESRGGTESNWHIVWISKPNECCVTCGSLTI